MQDRVRDYPMPISDWQEVPLQEGRDDAESKRVEQRIQEQRERETQIRKEREKKKAKAPSV